jgi:hypothetical protein
VSSEEAEITAWLIRNSKDNSSELLSILAMVELSSPEDASSSLDIWIAAMIEAVQLRRCNAG